MSTDNTLSANQAQINSIAGLLKQHNATIVAHYYTPALVQQIAEATGGFIGDSLEMARFGATSDASTLVVCGVKFMGESAKILSPHKKVIMPSLEATCSLDIGCQADDFKKFCSQYPNHTKVVYANTSAAVKAQADWVVTSSIALQVIEYLDNQDQQIIWAPDKYLGSYIEKKLDVKMVKWDGSCIVHEEFKAQGILDLKNVYPHAAVLVHPESPETVIQLADIVGSTTQLLKAAQSCAQDTLIVATDKGIFYKMQQAAPNKTLIAAPTAGSGATCKSCAMCPWMAMNNLDTLRKSLEQDVNEIFLPEDLIQQAYIPLERMLNFQAQ